MVQVEQLRFDFAAQVDPFQYEQGGLLVAGWPVGAKVVDVVTNEPPVAPTIVWFIEAKDYRVITSPPKPANLVNLSHTVEAKVRHTRAALAVVAAGSPDKAAAAHAGAAAAAGRVRVVLHLEPHAPTGAQSKLFPRGFSANVLLKLQQLVKDLDATPLVLDIARTPAAGVPWTVA